MEEMVLVSEYCVCKGTHGGNKCGGELRMTESLAFEGAFCIQVSDNTGRTQLTLSREQITKLFGNIILHGKL